MADLRDGGLVAVKYSRKGKGYVKTGIPEFKEAVPPRRKAHLRRLNRLGRLMSELANEDIPLWMKKDNQADDRKLPCACLCGWRYRKKKSSKQQPR